MVAVVCLLSACLRPEFFFFLRVCLLACFVACLLAVLLVGEPASVPREIVVTGWLTGLWRGKEGKEGGKGSRGRRGRRGRRGGRRGRDADGDDIMRRCSMSP